MKEYYHRGWRKEFKTEWNKLTTHSIKNVQKYLTDHQNWTCSCPYFLKNRFLLCKHLVNPLGKMDASFFRKVCYYIILKKFFKFNLILI